MEHCHINKFYCKFHNFTSVVLSFNGSTYFIALGANCLDFFSKQIYSILIGKSQKEMASTRSKLFTLGALHFRQDNLPKCQKI